MTITMLLRLSVLRASKPQQQQQWMRWFSRSAGLVGMPNCGKSSLFNAFIKQQLALSANYPFATIDPNCASAILPDARLDALATLSGTTCTVRQEIQLHDIAGLIEGAAQGAGMGNAFLSNIRSVSCILHVLRAFHDNEILFHESVPSVADPVRDLLIIENELILADLQRCETTMKKRAVGGEAAVQLRLLTEASKLLSAGLPARLYESKLTSTEREPWRKLGLLTAKPSLIVCNVAVEHCAMGNELTKSVGDFLAQRAVESGSTAPADSFSIVSAKLEEDVSLLPAEERAPFLEEFGLLGGVSGLDSILQRTAELLGLQVFYTTGMKETRAWPVPVGATAAQAAGTIHTDFETHFIKAAVIPYEEFISSKGTAKPRAEGRDYTMRDGDVVEFFSHK